MREWERNARHDPKTRNYRGKLVTDYTFKALPKTFGALIDTFRLQTHDLREGDDPTDALDSYEEKDGRTIQYRHTPIKLIPKATQACVDILLPSTTLDNKSENQYYGLEVGPRDLATFPSRQLSLAHVLAHFTIYDVPVAAFPFAAATVYAPKGYAGAYGTLNVADGYTINFTLPNGAPFALSPSTVPESTNDYVITPISPTLLSPATLQLTADIVCAGCRPQFSITLKGVYAPVSAPTQNEYAVPAGTALAGVTFSLPSLEDYPGLSNSVFMDADSGDGFAIDGNGLVTGTPSGSGAQIIRGLWTADGMLGALTLELTLTPPETSAADPERENAVPPSADFSAVLCEADNCQNASVLFPSSGHVKESPSQKIKAPRAAAPAAACVAGRSTGQHMLPQPPSKQTATAPRPLCVVPKLRACETIPQTKTSSCRLS